MTALTSLREQVLQPSAPLVLLCREATHLNCPQPLLYLQMWGGAGGAASPSTYRS